MKVSKLPIISILTVSLLVAAWGCTRDTEGLGPAPFITDPVVFEDVFGLNVEYEAFAGSDFEAISTDNVNRHSGTASLKISVPDAGAGWVGGAFTTDDLRDLTGYDALTFWAKASKSISLNVAGIANDNTGTSKYTAQWENFPISTLWEKYIIPIPRPSKLNGEGGLFFFAEDAEGAEGHDIWFDDIMFEKLEPGTITNPRPVMTATVYTAFVGGTVEVSGTSTTFNVDGTDVEILHSPRYFTYYPDADSVATGGEIIKAVGPGTTEILGYLGETPVSGVATLDVSDAPKVPAPKPTVASSKVISMFSNVYNDINVETWSANWPDMADVEDFKVAGDDVKAYTNLYYCGIVFENDQIDATDMDFLHIDVWVPEGVTFFKVKLVDFGEDGAYLGAPDSFRELTFDSMSDPPLVNGEWLGLDIPIEDFMFGPNGLFAREHLAQMLLSGHGTTAFVDNIFFYRTD